MTVTVTRWRVGCWHVVPGKVVKLTKLHVIIQHGNGVEKFNRRTGRVVGGMAGLASAINPVLTQESIATLAHIEDWK